MKKLKPEDAIVLLRVIVAIACCTLCTTSIILLPFICGVILSGLSLIALTLILTATEPYVRDKK